MLGVHPNTVRAWSDAGRLHYYRINERGDRRYRLVDLQRFLSEAESAPAAADATWQPHAARREVATPTTLTDTPAGVDLLADLAEIASFPSGLDQSLEEACRLVRVKTGAALVGIWERRPGGLVPRAIAVEGPGVTGVRALPRAHNLFAEAIESSEPLHVRPGTGGPEPVLGTGTDELIVRIPGGEAAWGVLVIAGGVELGSDDGRRLSMAIARTLGVLVRGSIAAEQASGSLRRSEALRRIATDLASRLDVGDVVRDLGDHARVLFGADRVGVVLYGPEGRTLAPIGTGFSDEFMAALTELVLERATSSELPTRRPTVLLGPEAARSNNAIRAATVQEGCSTLVVAPLVDAHELLGMLYLGHDRPYRWRSSDLDSLEALAGDAATAVRSARTFGRMATWAAQLQSIQRLGARLSGLTGVERIGHAIATELRQVIDYQNARVYRVVGGDLVPIAALGQGDTYAGEDRENLRVAVGEGITGWVAQHNVPQLVDDTASDPRAITMPGSEPDLDESMLAAPMVHEGHCLGVLVLVSEGLHKFTEDDLRLLVIYASFAAQAMANADATELLRGQSKALERQLLAQRELLTTTESILTTLDQRAVLEQITDRLGTLVESDRVAIRIAGGSTGDLVPLTARGAHGPEPVEPWSGDGTGIASWAMEHNEAVLITGKAHDERLAAAIGDDVEGSLIAVPLLGQRGPAGVLTLERSDREAPFDDLEFELVKLFAGQVSIALRNAEIYQAAEIRARTDDLTGLLNHRTFGDRLEREAARDDAFGLVMIDLDEFKTANDTLGHQAGDRLLRDIAAAIRSAARETDAVFRYGGDEFAVILPGTDDDGLLAAAERIMAAIGDVGAEGGPWHDGGLQVGASIGIASFPTDGRRAPDVLLAADRACFVAKRRGRGEVATAAEGLALAAEFTLSEPTPVDPPSPDEPPIGDSAQVGSTVSATAIGTRTRIEATDGPSNGDRDEVSRPGDADG